MKIIVDKIPEHPKDCLFSRLSKNDNKYYCNFSHSLCPYYEEGWNNECPYLKKETIGSIYSTGYANSTHSISNALTY